MKFSALILALASTSATKLDSWDPTYFAQTQEEEAMDWW